MVIIYYVTTHNHTFTVASLYQVIKIHVCAWDKTTMGLLNRRLIKAAVLYLLTTVLYFQDIMWQIQYCIYL